MLGQFTASVKAWALKSEQRMTAVFRTAAQTIANEVRIPRAAGGNMPVVTGNLRRSLLASTSPLQGATQGGSEFADNDGQINAVIANATIGEVVYLGFQAAYARRLEYGFVGQDSLGRTYNQAPAAFVRSAVQRWPQIVNEATEQVKSRIR
jgi:hypothetical protein